MGLPFARKLRERVRQGEITRTVRIWRSPRVKVGGRYALDGGGFVEVTALREIALEQVTPALARESGFEGLVDLLKTARHGAGERVFVVEFDFREA